MTALLLLLATFAHADTLDCDLARGDARLALQAPIADDGGADAQTSGPNELGLALDSSLDAATWLLVLDDLAKQRRVAFSGSARGVTPDGATLSLGADSVACRQTPAGKCSLEPPASPQLPDYFVCMVDEAHYLKGEIESSKRRLFRVNTPLAAHLPIDVAADDDGVAFRVRYVDFDPFHGLEISLTDRQTGEVANYRGPARSMLASLLFGLTIGDRAVDARFLRLGCVWTSDPSPYASE